MNASAASGNRVARASFPSSLCRVNPWANRPCENGTRNGRIVFTTSGKESPAPCASATSCRDVKCVWHRVSVGHASLRNGLPNRFHFVRSPWRRARLMQLMLCARPLSSVCCRARRTSSYEMYAGLLPCRQHPMTRNSCSRRNVWSPPFHFDAWAKTLRKWGFEQREQCRCW